MNSCATCGTIENLQTHHISYEPEIIQLLCKKCHIAKHNHGTGKIGTIGPTATLEIKKSTHAKLAELGEYGNSMDDIINKLINTFPKKAKK